MMLYFTQQEMSKKRQGCLGIPVAHKGNEEKWRRKFTT